MWGHMGVFDLATFLATLGGIVSAVTLAAVLLSIWDAGRP